MLATVLGSALNFYGTLIVIYIIMTWLPLSGAFGDIRNALGSITEPYLGLFRRFIPPFGSLDFSPVIAIIVLSVIEQLIYRIL